MNLRWFNGELQTEATPDVWVSVPVVIDPNRPPVRQCPDCGQFFTNGHTCWLADD